MSGSDVSQVDPFRPVRRLVVDTTMDTTIEVLALFGIRMESGLSVFELAVTAISSAMSAEEDKKTPEWDQLWAICRM